MTTVEDLTQQTIATLAPRLERKEISPVELTQAHLRRIEDLNSRLNAYLTVLSDSAMDQAREAEAAILRGQYKGPLHGIPIALKDIIAVEGIRMTCGSKILANQVAKNTATVARKLDEAGTILLGKLNLHEFAWGGTSINPHYGPPRNPWDPERIAGGSSGGSSSATAASMAIATLGTDTGGSVRVPACLTGVVGMKATYGRVSRYGVFPLCWSLDHVGPLTRSVMDAAIVLGAISGYDPADPTTVSLPVPDYAKEITKDVRGMRIGVPRTPFYEDLDPDVEQAVEKALGVLRDMGATCMELEMPPLQRLQGAAYSILVSESYAVHQDMLRTNARDYGVDVRMKLALGSVVPASHYLKAQRFRSVLTAQVNEALEKVDVLVTPTSLMTAPRIDEPVVDVAGKKLDVSNVSRFTRPFNLTGMPAATLPCGFDSRDLPIGLQVVGKQFDEVRVLQVAHAYEQQTTWHKKRPAL